MRTVVTNLSTMEEAVYDLPPDQAVVAAFEQHTKGNWEYPKPVDHPSFIEGEWSYGCGDWVVIKRFDILAVVNSDLAA